MHRSLRRLCSRPSVSFRPHLHSKPCIICDSAQAALSSACDGKSSLAATPIQSPLASSKDAPPRSKGAFKSRAVLTAAAPAASGSTLSVVESRRDALRTWLRTFTPAQQVGSAVEGNGWSLLTTSDEFEASYNAYLSCDDKRVEEELYGVLLETLDRQCARSSSSSSGSSINSQQSPAVNTHKQDTIRIPTVLSIPRVNAHKGAAADVASLNAACDNAFETHVRRLYPADETAVTKQLRFQTALLAIKGVLDSVCIPFFLACGTALGARRDGCFIPYDEDIDLGILYTDLATSSSIDSQKSTLSDDAAFSASRLATVQHKLYALLDALSTTGAFMVFDVCGAVEKGLEVRVLHMPTNTRVDINLYYPPVPGSDDALVQSQGSFLWASSFYEAAGQRRHHMYRYRHQPFEKDLTRLSFCAVNSNDKEGFLVPPERYLVENYGADWRTPKQYSYTEGLAHEFKNIIEE